MIRIIKPDKVESSVIKFISKKLGQKFVDPPEFNLAETFKDASKTNYMVFVLCAGADPMAEMEKIAAKEGAK